MYWLPKLETPTPDLHAANHGLIQVHWALGTLALMEKWITFACNPQVLASQEIFAITKAWGRAGEDLTGVLLSWFLLLKRTIFSQLK